MKPIRLISALLLTLAVGSTATQAMAAAALAVGNANYSYMALEQDDIETAEQVAMEGCAKKDNNCRVLLSGAEATAFAIAKGDDGMAAQTDPNPEKARQKAMANCKKYGNCRFVALYWEPGTRWAAFASARGESNQLLSSSFRYDGNSREKVETEALAQCQDDDDLRKSGKKCKVEAVWKGSMFYSTARSPKGAFGVGASQVAARAREFAISTCQASADDPKTCKIDRFLENPGPQAEPKNFKAVLSMTAIAREAAAPARVSSRQVNNTSCTNQCTNGICLRTFPNGRTERWQAPRIFDPLANDWKWDTNSCGR